jgi:hypothetical protein
LPNAFLEAAAHGCALLSLTDPDGFTSRFGAVAREETLEDELRGLLENDRWRARGAAAREFVAEAFATPIAVREHIEAYERLLAARAN